MPSRPYELKRRAEARDERRSRIVAAAREELLDGGRFSLEAVAERAAVSRVTVYAQFGDRDTLLEAVYDDLAASGGLQRIPEAFAVDDPIAGLGAIVEVFCHFYSVHRDVIRRLQALAVLSDDERSIHANRNSRRRHILGVLLGRAGVEDDALVDTLQALTSFAFVDELAGADRAPDAVAGEVTRLLVAAVTAGRQPTWPGKVIEGTGPPVIEGSSYGA
jgi:AcrR family transcriptional regulator